GDCLLVDQLADDGAQLGRRALEVETAEVVEVDPLEQLAMDAQLQVLVGTIDRRPSRSGPCRRCRGGRGSGRGSSGLCGKSDSVSQSHDLVSLLNIRRNRCPREVFPPVPATPPSLVASSPIANERPACRVPFNGTPEFVAVD